MGRSALIEAAEHGHADIVKLLIEHNANVNLQDQEGVLQDNKLKHSVKNIDKIQMLKKRTCDCKLISERN